MTEMHRYIIGINYDECDNGPGIVVQSDTTESKTKFLIDNERTNAQFQVSLNKWLESKGFSSEIEFDEPFIFPIIAVRCTLEVANTIQQFPGVEFIRPDGV